MAGCVDPSGFIIFPDPEVGPDKILSVTSEYGPKLGPVVPDEGNFGQMAPVQSGTPSTSAVNVELLQKNSGGHDRAEWLWRFEDEADENWRGLDDVRRIWGYTMPWGYSGGVPDYNVAAAYVSKYNRIVIVRDTSIRYRDADGDFTAWSSTSWSPEFTNASDGLSGFNFALDMVELQDGTLLMAALVDNYNPADHTNPNRDFDLYRSADGGLTWSRVSARVLLNFADKTSALAYNEPDPISKFRLTRSGQYIRLTYISTQGTTVNEDLHTLVSSDGGASWVELTPINSTPFSNHSSYDAYPHAVVGLGDGSFYMEIQNSATAVTAFRSHGASDWVSLYGTSKSVTGALYSIGLVLHHGYVYGWYWDEDAGGGANDSGIIIGRMRVEDINTLGGGWDLTKQQTHVARYRFMAPILLSTGAEIVGVVTNIDHTGGGLGLSPSVMQQGGWTQRSLGRPGRGWTEDAFPSDYDGQVVAHWAASFGLPAPAGASEVSPDTEWTRSTGTGTPSQSWTGTHIQLVGAATGESIFFSFQQGTASGPLGWANHNSTGSTVYAIMYTGSGDGDITADNIGLRIESSLDTGTADRVVFQLRIAHDSLAIHDEVAGSNIWTYSGSANEFTTEHEFRVVFSSNALGNVACRVMWKPIADYAGDWTEGTLTTSLTTFSTTSDQVFSFGHLGHNQSGAMSSFWREVGVLQGDAKYRLGGASENPEALAGMPAGAGPVHVQGGRMIYWAGAAGQRGDTFTARIDRQNPVRNIFHPSPRVAWESADNASQEIILDAGEGNTWQVSDIALIGINCRRWVIDFDSDPAFGTPRNAVQLLSDISYTRVVPATPYTVGAFTGSMMQWATPTSGLQEEMLPGSLRGRWVEFTSGALSGNVYEIRKDVGDRRLHLDTGGATLTSLGLLVGDEFAVFGDVAVGPLDHGYAQYRYIRLRPYSDSASGRLRLGSVVLGTGQPIAVPLDWEQTSSEQPNITEYRTRSGIGWTYQEGPPQRTFVGRLVGDANVYREEFRARLRNLAEYRKPVFIVLDDSDYELILTALVYAPRSIGSSLYGRITSGAQLDQSAWFANDENGLVINRQAGDMSITIVEES